MSMEVTFVIVDIIWKMALVVSARWLVAGGVSALWGAFTFPLAALATALMVTGGGFLWPGVGLTLVASGGIPWVLWWVLKRWPGGKLAAVTNAAKA